MFNPLPHAAQFWLSIALSGRTSFQYDGRGANDIGFSVSIAAVGLATLASIYFLRLSATEVPEIRRTVSSIGGDSSQKGQSANAASSSWKSFQILLRWVLPHVLPWSVVACVCAFSHWTFTIGAEFSASTLGTVFFGFMAARQLSSSWIQVALSAFVICVYHTVLVIVALTRATNSHVNRLDSLASYNVHGSQLFEAVYLFVAFIRGVVLVVATSRIEDRETREDYILDAGSRHCRNVSQSVVESMIPGPVAAEMRSRMAQGMPPSLSWKFDMVCILQSDIVGFTRCDGSILAILRFNCFPRAGCASRSPARIGFHFANHMMSPQCLTHYT